MSTTSLFVDSVTVVDRSELERYSICPKQARLSARVPSVGRLADVGSAIHDAVAKAIAAYVDSRGSLSRTDLQNEAEFNLMSVRADVQAEAVQGFRRNLYSWSRYICDIGHHENIVRFDGGEGARSGQLAWDLDSLGLRITSEVDLLHRTASKEVLSEVDYKTGWKFWTAEDVKNAFQFRLHAWLVFHNYPDCQALRVSVWNTRTANVSWPTEFTRADLPAIDALVRGVAGEWHQYHDSEAARVPAWPSREKCAICNAAALCDVVDLDIGDVAKDPQEFLKRTAAVEASLKARKKLLGAYVRKTGQDIVTDDGTAYGFCKPKSSRTPSQSLYSIRSNCEPDE